MQKTTQRITAVRRLAVPYVLLAGAWLGLAGHPASASPQNPHVLNDKTLAPRINLAIETGMEHLLRRQHRDGSWTGQAFGSYRAGPTAFSAYALIESGMRPNSPAIVMALDYLRRNPPKMTYSAGALLLLLAEIGDPEHKDWGQETVDLLASWESQSVRGSWGYPTGVLDLSNTQFVALGFWAASRMGLKVPIEVTKRMIETTIEVHQEEPYSRAGGKKAGRGRSAGTRGKIAGFHYFTEHSSRPVSASMTASGICIQRIGRLVHGKKLGRKLMKAMDQSERMALDWIDAHWSTSENYGHHEDQLGFYLWALERLGAFYESETIAGHPWYEEGAKQFLLDQGDDDGWGRLHGTCYALLFLSRASSGAVTGTDREARTDLWIQDEGAVRLRVSGRMDLVAYVERLLVDDGTRVDRVEWVIDGEIVQTIKGDPNQPWKDERFPMRWSSETAGRRSLVAVVHTIGADGQAEELRSKPLEIQSAWTTAEWMARAAAAKAPNLLRGLEFTVEASSAGPGQDASQAVDAFEGTAWIATGEDPTPTITFQLAKPVRVSALTLSHAASSIEQIPSYAGARRVRVTAGKKAIEHEILPQSPGPIVLPFPKALRVRSIQIEILEAEATAGNRRGFAEIGLLK